MPWPIAVALPRLRWPWWRAHWGAFSAWCCACPTCRAGGSAARCFIYFLTGRSMPSCHRWSARFQQPLRDDRLCRRDGLEPSSRASAAPRMPPASPSPTSSATTARSMPCTMPGCACGPLRQASQNWLVPERMRHPAQGWRGELFLLPWHCRGRTRKRTHQSAMAMTSADGEDLKTAGVGL